MDNPVTGYYYKYPEANRKIHYAYKKVCKIFSASSTRTAILIWKSVNEQIL